MKIDKIANAGSLESNDVLVTVKPYLEGINIEIDSIVKNQFGKEIERVVLEQLEAMRIENIDIHIQDKGALNCVLKARVETAVIRGGI